jgi:hypothetical protein
MIPEDRVVTTDGLRAAAGEWAGNAGSLVISATLLDRLEPTALHVVVPAGHVHGPGEPTLVCHLVLAAQDAPEPVRVRTLVTVDQYESLPTAFEALRTASTLIPGISDSLASPAACTHDTEEEHPSKEEQE